MGSLDGGGSLGVGISDYYGSSYTAVLGFCGEMYSADYFTSNNVCIWALVIQIQEDPTVTHLIRLNSSDFK